MLEYNLVETSTKPTMLRYFQESLKPFILVELKYWDLKLETFNQMVKKAIDVETKVVLQSYSSTWEMDQYCPYGNYLANFTVVKS